MLLNQSDFSPKNQKFLRFTLLLRGAEHVLLRPPMPRAFL